jgi:cytochrome P450
MFRVLAQTMLTLDDPDHRRLRKLVDSPFRRDRIEALRPSVIRIADELLDEMERLGNYDLVLGFSRELPLRVIAEMLGLPDELRKNTQAWMGRFADIRSLGSALGVLPNIGRMMKEMRKEFARRRSEPGPGLVSELVQAESDGDRLSEDELLGMVFLLFIAGHETTTHLISTAMLDLLQHPSQLEMLRADPGLMANAVEELHRHNSPVQATKPRMARHDMEFHGVRLKQGDRVFGLLASSNADPAHFADPERLDLARPGVRHAGYGGGMHLCLGMHLARIETEIALERILARWPSIALGQPAEEIRWLPRPGMRGPLRLPLKVHRSAGMVAAA